MKNIIIKCEWGLNFELFDKNQIELYVDEIPTTQIPEETKRFVFLLEPPEIKDLTLHAINGLENNTYNFLLTHNQQLLNYSNKAKLFEFGGCWIKDYNFTEKTFTISTLVGGKLMSNGHYLRQILLNNINRIVNPKKIFISSHFPLKNKIENNDFIILENEKNPLFDSQFHICIENTKRENWFTEKLIDCLITKTIPIYWGCPNIGDWFNLDGFFIVDNIEDIINVSNSLNKDIYKTKILAIEENYEKAKQFVNLEERLKNKIKELI